jgi:integrase/recombinase XerD
MIPKAILWTDTTIKEGPNKGLHPVKIRVTITEYVNGKKVFKVFRGTTNVHVSKSEFKSLMVSPKAKHLQEKRIVVDACLAKAASICKNRHITLEAFGREYYGAGNFESITGMFEWYLEKMDEDERTGNMAALTSAMRSLLSYKRHLLKLDKDSEVEVSIGFAEITVEWMNGYKRWMLENGKALSTVYIYARALRTIMHLAVSKGKISKESIPFGKDKFKIPASKAKNRKVKLSLPKDELIREKNKILDYVSDDHKVYRALNYWKASFWANGCNMADLAYMTFRDKDDRMINFQRKKTEYTEEDSEPIVVWLSDELREIIRIEGNKSVGDPDQYIFPILSKGMDHKKRLATIKQFTKVTNKWLKKAAKGMDLKIPLTSGTARYLTATLLRRHGIDLDSIRKRLGHSSTDTTEHYADDNDVDLMKSINKILAG